MKPFLSRHPYTILLSGGKHDARELDIVALEMAANINQAIKDVDCVRVGGENAITTAHQKHRNVECELEQLKKEVRCKFAEKVVSFKL